MEKFRKIITWLLVFPLGVLFYLLTHPTRAWADSGVEVFALLVALPIIVLNFFAWFYPDALKAYLPTRQEIEPSTEAPNPAAPLAKSGLLAGLIAGGLLLGIGLTAGIIALNQDRQSALRPKAIHPPVLNGPGSKASLTPIYSPSPTLPDPPGSFSAFPKGTLTPKSTSAPLVLGGNSSEISPAEATATAKALASSPAIPNTDSKRCVSATNDVLDVIRVGVLAFDSDNKIETGWMVKSNLESTLWFTAAKIEGPEIDSNNNLPAVWAVFLNEDGSMFIFSVNEPASQRSYLPLGQDSTPVTSMESDGAQDAYACSLNGP